MIEQIVVSSITCVISSIAGAAIGTLRERKRKDDERATKETEEGKAMRDGMTAILRDRIIQAHNHYVEERGWCPISVKQSIALMYKAYHALGGNGLVTQMYEALMELPTTEPKERA